MMRMSSLSSVNILSPTLDTKYIAVKVKGLGFIGLHLTTFVRDPIYTHQNP